jgi:hypothetical protein
MEEDVVVAKHDRPNEEPAQVPVLLGRGKVSPTSCT